MKSLKQEILDTLTRAATLGESRRHPVTGKKYAVVSRYVESFGEDIEIEIPHQDFERPAFKFEKKYKMKGIAGRYKFPGGLKPSTVENYAVLVTYTHGDPHAGNIAPQTGRLWRRLQKLNPELKALDRFIVEDRQIFNAVVGVTSGFSVSDIKFFLTHAVPFEAMCKTEKYNKLLDIFNARASKESRHEGLVLQWAASPKTLKKISRKFQARI